MSYRAAIIGLGCIGQEYDYDLDSNIYTHANAYSSHSSFELVAGVDVSQAQRERFGNKFGKPSFENIEALKREGLEVDIFSITTPNDLHREQLFELLELEPKIIICEKPLATDYQSCVSMVDACRDKGIPLMVNYFRRFEPAHLSLKETIRSNNLGKLIAGTVYYKRGLLTNASHFIDILINYFGMPNDFDWLGGRDKTSRFYLAWENSEIVFLPVDETEYNFFEVELIFSKAVVNLRDSGANIEVRKIDSNKDLSSRSCLGGSVKIDGSDFHRYQYHVQDNAYRNLAFGDDILSSGMTALESMKIVFSLLNSKSDTTL